MIFYEVLGTSAAPYCLVGTQVDAKRLAKERGTSFEQVDVPTDKAGLMDYINQLKIDVSAELHRGATEAVDSFNRGMAVADAHPQQDPIKQSIQTDEDFEKLPIARQLHFAAIAMENAREALP